MQVCVFNDLYPVYGVDEVSGEVVIEKLLSYTPLFLVREQA
jgi:hypothetical protein